MYKKINEIQNGIDKSIRIFLCLVVLLFVADFFIDAYCIYAALVFLAIANMFVVAKIIVNVQIELFNILRAKLYVLHK